MIIAALTVRTVEQMSCYLYNIYISELFSEAAMSIKLYFLGTAYSTI
jgi:hypothetical protein